MIKQMVGHSPNSRVTEKHYLHLPSKAVQDAVLDVYELAAE